MGNPEEDYKAEREKYKKAWEFLIPRFLEGWHWYQQLSAGLGWVDLVKSLTERLDHVWEGFEGKKGSECWGILQCKEKFGGLRFYSRSTLQEDESEVNEDFRKRCESFRRLISQYESSSFNFCENCGSPGQLRSVGGWLATNCQKHYSEWLARRVEDEKRTHKERATCEYDLMDKIEKVRRGLPLLPREKEEEGS